MKIDFQKIEATLREFFEQDLQIVAHKNPLQNLTNEIIAVMEKNLKQSGEKVFAPNMYRISIRDKDLVEENDIKEWKKYIQEIIKEITRDNTFQLAGPLHIEIFHNPKISEEFEIAVSNSSIPSGKTVNFFNENNNSDNNGDKENTTTSNSYLITADENYYSLTKAITNIGRREDNDLVIDNLRVSRVHAQIRLLNNKHILFDLDSTAGTKVNGIKIRQHTLNHGDVIEIADVPLIYGTELDQPPVEEKRDKTRMLSSNKHKKVQK
jgi:hypothetical protein